jgi:hypothetical protein
VIPLRRAVALGVACGLASRAVLAATVAWFVLLGTVYASDAGPVLPALAVTGAALFPISAWATSAQLAATSDDLRALLTAANGRRHTLLADALPPLLWVGGAAVAGVLAAAVFDPHPAPLRHFLLGAAVHLLAGACGTALALATHAYRLTRGTTAGTIVAATVATLLVRQLPPAGTALYAWSDPGHPRGTATAVWALLGPALLAAALLAGAAAARNRRL